MLAAAGATPTMCVAQVRFVQNGPYFASYRSVSPIGTPPVLEPPYLDFSGPGTWVATTGRTLAGTSASATQSSSLEQDLFSISLRGEVTGPFNGALVAASELGGFFEVGPLPVWYQARCTLSATSASD
jgi:hypothetical protein